MLRIDADRGETGENTAGCEHSSYSDVHFSHLRLWTSKPRAAKLFCVGRCIHGCSNNASEDNLDEKF